MALLASPGVAQRFRVDLPPALVAAPLDLSVPTLPVSLARIVADLPVGQTWAITGAGARLLDEKGWVVGLTDLAFAPNGVSQNINFFIPIDEALKALGLNAPG